MTDDLDKLCERRTLLIYVPLAFLDSDAGRNANREKPTEDGFRENDRGGRFRGTLQLGVS